jgi:hypothetical protein
MEHGVRSGEVTGSLDDVGIIVTVLRLAALTATEAATDG